MEEALIEMYLAGITVRRVEDIAEALWGTRVSPSTVSNLNKKIYAKIEAWRNRCTEGEHRGLHGVQLIISDACRGLMESAAEYLPRARWQRCMVHFYRNVFSHVPTTGVREVSHMLKAIHAQENREGADRKARAIVEDLRCRQDEHRGGFGRAQRVLSEGSVQNVSHN